MSKFGWLKGAAHVVGDVAAAAQKVVDNPIGNALLKSVPGVGAAVNLLSAVHDVQDSMHGDPGAAKADAAFSVFTALEGLTGDLADDTLVKDAAYKAMTAYVTAQKAAADAKAAVEAFEAVIADAKQRHAA